MDSSTVLQRRPGNVRSGDYSADGSIERLSYLYEARETSCGTGVIHEGPVDTGIGSDAPPRIAG
jgi:hypothetical protein